MKAIARYSKLIQKRVDRRASIKAAIIALKSMQNDIGSQKVMDAIQVLVSADFRLYNEINKLKERINVLFEQPRC